MRLKRPMAFLIALSVIVGLVFAAPASAALDVATGYTEEVLLEEYFDGSSYDRNQLYIENGTVSEEVLSFELDKQSSVSYTNPIDTENNYQYTLTFDLGTEVVYQDPWTATYIGMALEENAIKPTGNKNGAWVGITQDKVILWFSDANSDAYWGATAAEAELDYYVFDAPIDLTGASYRIIAQGTSYELQYLNVDTYVTLVSLSGSYQFSFTDPAKITEENTTGAVTFAAPRTITNDRFFTYVSVSNDSSDIVVDDPFNPAEPDEDAPAPKKVTLDNLIVTEYRELLATTEQLDALAAYETEINAILAAYETEDESDDIYKKNSVNAELLEDWLVTIGETLAEAEILSADVAIMLSDIDAALLKLVSPAQADEFIATLDTYKGYVVAALAEVESGVEDYSEAALEEFDAMLDGLRATVNSDKLSKDLLDKAIDTVKSSFASIDVYSEQGFPAYAEAFDENVDTVAFAKAFTTRDYTQDSFYVKDSGYDIGIPVGVKFNPNPYGRFQMVYKSGLSTPYSVQATLYDGAVYSTMTLRTVCDVVTNLYELDGMSGSIGEGIGLYGVQLNHRGTLVDVVVKDGNQGGIKKYTTIDLSAIPDAIPYTSSVTVLARDYGEVIEFYIVDTNGNEIPAATVEFDSLIKNVTFNKSYGQYPELVTRDCYTDGKIVNEITGEVVEFTDMRAPVLSSASTVSFQAREGSIYVKDLEIRKNIKAAIPEYIDGFAAPTSLAMTVDATDNTFTVGDTVNFSVVGEFDELKVIGRDKSEAGSYDVTKAGRTSYSTLGGDSIITVNAAGTITANRAGTEIVTATYTFTDESGAIETATASQMVYVEDIAFTAPSATDLLDKRIEEPVFANADAFKSIDEGLAIIPVVNYTLFNGNTECLERDIYAEYFTTNADIIEYDYATGKYVAKEAGTAEIWATVHTTFGEVEGAKVVVEVTEAGQMTPGINTGFALTELLVAADDYEDYTTDELKAVLASAKTQGIDLPYEDDTDVALLFAALNALPLSADVDDVKTAYAESLLAREVYDIVSDEETTSADLGEYFFGREGKYQDFGVDKRLYDNLTDSKKSRAMTRIFTQIDKKGLKLTVGIIGKIINDIIDVTEGGGSSGKESNTNKTNSNLGNGVFSAPGTPAVSAKTDRVDKAEAEAMADTFTDINDAPWAKIAIGNLVVEKIAAGYGDNTIKPNGTITRDEFVKLLVVAFGLDLAEATTMFSDIDYSAWQNPYISTAVKAGIVNGIGNNMFGSGREITREDMAVMIVRAAEMLGYTIKGEKIVNYVDADEISDYALAAVNKLSASGIVSGMGDDTFAPGAPATRAQAMYIINAVKDFIR